MTNLGGREPAFWIGLVVTIVLGIVQTLMGEGLISDVQGGKATDAVNAIAQLAVLLAPLIAGLIIRPQVTPVSQPALDVGTPVLIKGTNDTPPPDAVVALK